jgi:hypothetical protein
MTRDIHENLKAKPRRSGAAVVRANIKRDIRTAWIVAHTLRERGCWPAKFRSNMPDVVREFFESYGLEKEKIGNLPPSNKAIDIHDAVHIAMASKKLCDYDRLLLWRRAANMGWKDIIRETYIPERTLKRHYAQALMIFGVAFGLVRPVRNEERQAA